jgi:hypothetical protein
MPMKKGHWLSALAAAALAVTALPAAASAATFDTGACATPALSQPFAGTGDPNSYFLAPGGDFEQKGLWNAYGRVDYPRESRGDDWAGDTVVRLTGDTIVSPDLCVDGTYPHLRLAAKAGPGGSLLMIEAIVDDALPIPLATLQGSDYRSWTYSEFVPLAPALGLSLTQTTGVKLRIRGVGDWKVDGVSIDPRRGA